MFASSIFVLKNLSNGGENMYLSSMHSWPPLCTLGPIQSQKLRAPDITRISSSGINLIPVQKVKDRTSVKESNIFVDNCQRIHLVRTLPYPSQAEVVSKFASIFPKVMDKHLCKLQPWQQNGMQQ